MQIFFKESQTVWSVNTSPGFLTSCVDVAPPPQHTDSPDVLIVDAIMEVQHDCCYTLKEFPLVEVFWLVFFVQQHCHTCSSLVAMVRQCLLQFKTHKISFPPIYPLLARQGQWTKLHRGVGFTSINFYCFVAGWGNICELLCCDPKQNTSDEQHLHVCIGIFKYEGTRLHSMCPRQFIHNTIYNLHML